MQTEAAPREPFTLGALFRYKFTVFAVATVVILGGYVRIITQPTLYEAAARLMVRFSAESPVLSGSMESASFYRLPLLEEEVKSYITQVKDPEFLDKVVDSLPADDAQQDATPTEEPTAADKFRAQFMAAYYGIRKGVLSILDAILFSKDIKVTEREQKVSQILSRIDVTSGVEASHIITVKYQNVKADIAASLVNTLCEKFIQEKKSGAKKKDEAPFLKVVEDAMTAITDIRKKQFAITSQLGVATIDEGIKKRYEDMALLMNKKNRLETAARVLDAGLIPNDRDLPLEAPSLMGEIERELLVQKMSNEEKKERIKESGDFYSKLFEKAEEYQKERKKAYIESDKKIVAAYITAVDAEIKRLLEDDKLLKLAPELHKLTLAESVAQDALKRTQDDLVQIRQFNKELDDVNVSQNVAISSHANIPSFPLPQHREIKLLVVIALGLFAGCGAALLRHQLRPRIVRRARPRSQEEVDVPLILLPDDGRHGGAKGLELDITFPEDDVAERGQELKR